MIYSFLVFTLLGTSNTPFHVRAASISAFNAYGKGCALTLWGSGNEVIVKESCDFVARKITEFELAEVAEGLN